MGEALERLYAGRPKVAGELAYHFEQAGKLYLLKALKLAREIDSQPAESYALNNLGNLHYLRGNYAEALECYADSLVLQRATHSRRGEASARDPGPPLNTFIVRFWREQGTGQTHWRGQVQHIQSGERIAFADEDTLLSFIRRWAQTLGSGKEPREEREP